MVVHEVKILPKFFNDVVFGSKSFEIRKDDRPGSYQIGDRMRLKEYDVCKGYTGRWYLVEITYKIKDFNGLIEGYCVLGIRPLCGVVI